MNRNYSLLNLVTLMGLIILTITSCDKKVNSNNPTSNNSTVLLLKVDYTTNIFMGAKEIVLPTDSPSFNITSQYVSPADFGSIKLTYKEINQTIFNASIIWMGDGVMSFPASFDSSSNFSYVTLNDTINPVAGFKDVFNPMNTSYDYYQVWYSVQRLTKVRQFLQNTTANSAVKLFLYTPGVGSGDPTKWYWVIFLKK